MSEPGNDDFEQQLRTLSPAPVSADLERRIQQQQHAQQSAPPKPNAKPRQTQTRWGLGAFDVAALVAIAVLTANIYLSLKPAQSPPPPPAPGADEGKTPELSEAEKAQVAALVEKLRSEDFDERQGASAELQKLDERFLPALRTLSEKADGEQRGRLGAIITAIEARVLLARLEKTAPGTSVFSTEFPADRQDAVIKWARKADGRTVIPMLVELCGKLPAGPQLWACWDAMNFWAGDRAFLASTPGSAWASGGLGNGSVYTQLLDRQKETWASTPPPLTFSDAAKQKCEAAKSPDQNMSAVRRTILANQLAVAGVGFCVSEDKISILTQAEGAAYWAAWWKAAQQRPEWQQGTIPIEQKVEHWLASLDSDNAVEQLKSRGALVDAWNEAAVQNAVKAHAQKDTPGARRAREILELTALRGLGKIVFTHDSDEIKSSAWIMNPDGSDQQPLKLDGYETTQWKLYDLVAGHFMLRRWDDQSYFWWKPGMAAPQLIAEKEVYNQETRPGTHQVIYWKRSERQQVPQIGEAGSIGVFDLDSHQHIALPKEMSAGVQYPQISPDGRWMLYSTPGEKRNATGGNACNVWVYDFKTNLVSSLMKSRPHADLSYVGLHWSLDSRWVSCTGFDMDGERNSGGLLWLANVETGEVRSIKPDGYFACPDLVWAPGASTAYLLFNKKGEPRGAREQRLFRWTPDGGLKPIEIPDAIITSNHGGNIMHLRPDGKLRISVEDEWLIDPTGKEPPQKGVAEEPPQPEALANGWSMLTTNAAPGLVDDQIVLISPSGARLPITYRQGGCRYPLFVAGPWPELKR